MINYQIIISNPSEIQLHDQAIFISNVFYILISSDNIDQLKFNTYIDSLINFIFV